MESVPSHTHTQLFAWPETTCLFGFGPRMLISSLPEWSCRKFQYVLFAKMAFAKEYNAQNLERMQVFLSFILVTVWYVLFIFLPQTMNLFCSKSLTCCTGLSPPVSRRPSKFWPAWRAHSGFIDLMYVLYILGIQGISNFGHRSNFQSNSLATLNKHHGARVRFAPPACSTQTLPPSKMTSDRGEF